MSLAPLSPAASSGDVATHGGELTRPQKVAVVLLALGADVAEVVLQQMGEVDVEQIAQEIVNLGSLSTEELLGVLDEFQTEARAHRVIVTGGEHHARELLRAGRGDEGDLIVDRLMATAFNTPFNFLSRFPADVVARELRDEHPQTIALVLAHVPSRMAAQVLQALPGALRAEVAVRVATLQPGRPEVISRVEDSLRARMGEPTRLAGGRGPAAGMRELANILNSADDETKQSILEAIEQSDETLASEVRSQLFVFEDLASLGDRDLQEVLRQIETAQLALAMKGLDGPLHDTIMRNLSERARVALNEERDLLGPVKASEIKDARAEIAGHIRQLVEDGTVTVMSGDAGDVVA